jgi:hypothetical protein
MDGGSAGNAGADFWPGMRAFQRYAQVRQLYIERTRKIPFGGHAPASGVDDGKLVIFAQACLDSSPGDFISSTASSLLRK